MKNLFFSLLIFITMPFLSYADVNGKGIICECINCKLDHIDPSSYISNKKPTEIGFHFKINKVAIYYISKIGDDIKVSENSQITLRKKKKFYTNNKAIRWTYKDSLNIYAYSLDRNTLDLTKMNITKTETFNHRKCKAFTEIQFFEQMNSLSQKYQTSYNKQSEVNKI